MHAVKRIAVILALLAVPGIAHAQLSLDAACAATTTSCSVGSTNTGHLKIVVAYNVAGTVPTLASGWTQVYSAVNGSTLFGIIVGCKVASGSGDTGSGTWANATRITQSSYGGSPVGNTGNCNTTGIGAFGSFLSFNTGNIECAGISLYYANGTSWVSCPVATASTGSNASCTASLTQQAVSTHSAACDSAGGISMFSTDMGAGPGGWATVDFELLGSGFVAPAPSQHGGVF